MLKFEAENSQLRITFYNSIISFKDYNAFSFDFYILYIFLKSKINKKISVLIFFLISSFYFWEVNQSIFNLFNYNLFYFENYISLNLIIINF